MSNSERSEEQQEQIDLEALKAKIRAACGNLKIYQKTVNFAENLRKKYPDYENYRLYHLLTGSSPREPEKMDFPGEDSIAKFIDSL